MKKLLFLFVDKKRLLYSTISMTVTGMVLLFCIVFLLGSSYGWFGHNNSTSSNGMQISLGELTNINASISVYPAIANDENNIYFSKTESSEAKLGTYSLLDNNARQILIKIDLGEECENISLSARTDTEYYLGDGSHPLAVTQNIANPPTSNTLSSIVSVSLVSVQETEYDGQAVQCVGNSYIENTFFDNNTFEKNGDISLVDNSTESVIYIILNYSDKLISQIYSVNIGNEDISENISAVYFYNDIIFELTQGE